MTAPRVSIVIPTYNRGKLLVQAVSSAIAQTFRDLEVIVADDGSDDGSLDLVAQLGDARVDVLLLDHSGIPAVARNAALTRARGEFVAFLDSDDVWYPEKLERQVAVLDTNPTVGLVCSNARVIDENGVEIGHLYLPPELGASGDVLEELLNVNFVIVSSAVARRELIDEAGRFGNDPRLRTVEDYDLWLRLGALSRTSYLAEPLLGYREHSASVRTDVPRAKYWTSLLVALDNLDRFLDAGDLRRQTLLRRRRAELLLELARAQRSEIGPAAAIRSLRVAVRLDSRMVAAHLVRRFARRAFQRANTIRTALHRALAVR